MFDPIGLPAFTLLSQSQGSPDAIIQKTDSGYFACLNLPDRSYVLCDDSGAPTMFGSIEDAANNLGEAGISLYSISLETVNIEMAQEDSSDLAYLDFLAERAEIGRADPNPISDQEMTSIMTDLRAKLELSRE